MGLGRPDDSRARPTTLIKNPEDYREMFDDKIPWEVYLVVAQTMKRVEAYTRAEPNPDVAGEKREFRFHLAMWAVAHKLGKRVYRPVQLIDLVNTPLVTSEELDRTWAELRGLLGSFGEFGKRSIDAIAKSPGFVNHVFDKGELNSSSVTPA